MFLHEMLNSKRSSSGSSFNSSYANFIYLRTKYHVNGLFASGKEFTVSFGWRFLQTYIYASENWFYHVGKHFIYSVFACNCEVGGGIKMVNLVLAPPRTPLCLRKFKLFRYFRLTSSLKIYPPICSFNCICLVPFFEVQHLPLVPEWTPFPCQVP